MLNTREKLWMDINTNYIFVLDFSLLDNYGKKKVETINWKE